MQHSDILIVGAGPTGLLLAIALSDAGRSARVIDARPDGAARQDKRILALSHGSRQILERLGAWPAQAATPITDIHVSQQGGFGRTRLRAHDYHVHALGYVVSASDLYAALDDRSAALGIAVDHDGTVTQLAPSRDEIAVTCTWKHETGADTLSARLVALAEGAIDDHAAAGHDYGQHAIICTATPQGGHHGMAYERFTPHGPLALLPFGRQYAVVLTVPAAQSDALLALDDAAFLSILQDCIGGRVCLTEVSARLRYPLTLRYRKSPAAERTVWLGNAAQTLHPVAGQGFNLALRDVWTLSRELARDPAQDPGAADLLDRYAAARRMDRRGTIGFTDALIRIFSNDFVPLRIARGGGLAALDLIPPLRHFLARRMMFGAR